LGIDVGIIPTLMDNIPMRDNYEINKIWAESARNIRSRIFECELQFRGPGSNASPLTNMSRFLQKLEHRSVENAEALCNHLKQPKFKIKGFGVEPNCYCCCVLFYATFG
jgi:hypothetical protein